MDKARGWGQLPVKMIKACGNSISFPLKLIFKSIINEGAFPEGWKKSNVPIYKKEKISLRTIGLSVFSQHFTKSLRGWFLMRF